MTTDVANATDSAATWDHRMHWHRAGRRNPRRKTWSWGKNARARRNAYPHGNRTSHWRYVCSKSAHRYSENKRLIGITRQVDRVEARLVRAVSVIQRAGRNPAGVWQAQHWKIGEAVHTSGRGGGILINLRRNGIVRRNRLASADGPIVECVVRLRGWLLGHKHGCQRQ